jgi:hypothetical protein
MTLPTRNDKDYLATAFAWGICIRVKKQHADELEALFKQHGLPCKRDPGPMPGESVLRFDLSARRDQVEKILQSYKLAQGS